MRSWSDRGLLQLARDQWQAPMFHLRDKSNFRSKVLLQCVRKLFSHGDHEGKRLDRACALFLLHRPWDYLLGVAEIGETKRVPPMQEGRAGSRSSCKAESARDRERIP